MAHPKRKISRTRRDKRRTHDALQAPSLAKCTATGVAHPLHQAYKHEGALYYRGQVLIKAPTQEATA